MSCAMENVVFFPRPKEAHIMSDYKVRLENGARGSLGSVAPVWQMFIVKLPVDCWA